LTVAEYHQSQYEIDAPNIEAAREMFLNNNRQLKMVDDSTEFIQIDPLHGDNGLIDIHPKDKVISEKKMTRDFIKLMMK